jgi:hypothetical protein
MGMVEQLRINPTGELPEPMAPPDAAAALDKLDGYQRTAADQSDAASKFTQMKGQFLIDRHGIVRWANIECAKEGLAGIGKFPTQDELITAARIVAD